MFICDLDIDQTDCVFGLNFCRYAESLYAVLSLGGLYYFVSGKNNFAVLLLALSGCARSNGALNAGYICFQTMHRVYHALFQNKNVTVSLLLLCSFLKCWLIVCGLFVSEKWFWKYSWKFSFAFRHSFQMTKYF